MSLSVYSVHTQTQLKRVRDGAIFAASGPVEPNPTPGGRPKIGFYGQHQTRASQIASYESYLGRQVDYILEFQGTESLEQLGWSSYMRGYFTPALMGTRQLMLGASLSPSRANGPTDYYSRLQTWRQLADGAFDSVWTTMATNLINTGLGSSVLRGAHEFNEPMFAHRVQPGEEAAFKDAWQRWHGITSSVPGANFLYNWNPTTGDENGQRIDVRNCYPGDAYVDTIDLDLYDRWYARGATPSAPREFSEQKEKWNQHLNGPSYSTPYWQGLTFWRDFAVSHGKGMGFSEWGLGAYFNQSDGNHGGGDNDYFVNQMADFILDPDYPPGSPGGVVDHAFWEDGAQGVRPLDPANPDLGRAIPVPKARAAFQARFGGA